MRAQRDGLVVSGGQAYVDAAVNIGSDKTWRSLLRQRIHQAVHAHDAKRGQAVRQTQGVGQVFEDPRVVAHWAEFVEFAASQASHVCGHD